MVSSISLFWDVTITVRKTVSSISITKSRPGEGEFLPLLRCFPKHTPNGPNRENTQAQSHSLASVVERVISDGPAIREGRALIAASRTSRHTARHADERSSSSRVEVASSLDLFFNPGVPLLGPTEQSVGNQWGGRSQPCAP